MVSFWVDHPFKADGWKKTENQFHNKTIIYSTENIFNGRNKQQKDVSLTVSEQTFIKCPFIE